MKSNIHNPGICCALVFDLVNGGHVAGHLAIAITYYHLEQEQVKEFSHDVLFAEKVLNFYKAGGQYNSKAMLKHSDSIIVLSAIIESKLKIPGNGRKDGKQRNLFCLYLKITCVRATGLIKINEIGIFTVV